MVGLFLAARGGDRVAASEPAGSGPDASRLLDGSALAIAAGREREDVVIFRRSRPRRLRLVEEGGAPIVGAGVRSAMFWSRENRCGVFSGADPLEHLRTDANGVVELIDGEIEYALTCETGDRVLYGQLVYGCGADWGPLVVDLGGG